MFVLAQVFSAIGAVLLLVSTFKDTKEKMLRIQIVDSFFNSIADALLAGWSGVMINIIGIVRNVSIIREGGKINKAAIGMLVFLTVLITVCFNPTGFLPLLAQIEYTIVVSRNDLVKSKMALSLNLLLWLLYDLQLRSYPVAIADSVIFVSSIAALVKTSKEQAAGERVASVNIDRIVEIGSQALKREEKESGHE